ncbi:DUF1853 family protein [Neolewinella persica]|uniref:DUF1853 family protein n=1 Tax=Neolewinella persica TaxID=70998 RepID=UPI00036E24B3|nr:DUF1853 family protein [Neolewinella persica]
MDLATKLRYQGCISTPPLWKSETVSPFKQIELATTAEAVDDSVIFKNHRLGKLVEEFVFHQVKSRPSTSWIDDNVQIQKDKRTVGEIDALFYDDGRPVHLEIAYKFYLYDTIEDYDEPLAYWIGPNRKDSLFYKLGKLHLKQFALLHSELTRPYLEDYKLEVSTIRQMLCFKAQLFLPYQNRSVGVSPLNSDCVAGFYLAFREIALFKGLKFFIPVKLDWLIAPHHDVEWISYASAIEIIEIDIISKRSPLVWVKQNDGVIGKFFVVFW